MNKIWLQRLWNSCQESGWEPLVEPNFLLKKLLLSKHALSCPHCCLHLKPGRWVVDAHCNMDSPEVKRAKSFRK